VVKIAEMSDSHLINTLAMLDRNFEAKVREAVGLDDVVVHDVMDGNAAFYTGLHDIYEKIVDAGIEKYFKHYSFLLDEAKNRGLIK
jgi:hypothetical protein